MSKLSKWKLLIDTDYETKISFEDIVIVYYCQGSIEQIYVWMVW